MGATVTPPATTWAGGNAVDSVVVDLDVAVPGPHSSVIAPMPYC